MFNSSIVFLGNKIWKILLFYVMPSKAIQSIVSYYVKLNASLTDFGFVNFASKSGFKFLEAELNSRLWVKIITALSGLDSIKIE